MRAAAETYIGQRFGQLVLEEITENRSADNHILARFECDCGRVTEKPLTRVLYGHVSTCGYRKVHPIRAIKHDMRYTSEYRIWQGIKTRMFNPNSKDFHRYGPKVGMSEKLATDFEAFYAEVGKRPSAQHSIDRINTTKGYVEGNLRWATSTEQQSNRKTSYLVTINGNVYASLNEAARVLHVSAMTISRWTDGFYDKRRGTYTPPKEGCSRERKY